MKVTLTPQTAVILLATLYCARATANMFSKFCFQEMEPLTLLAYRSLLACVILTPFLYRHIRTMRLRDLRAGVVFGSLFFLTMVASLAGLVTAEISAAAILENTSIVMVPLISAALSRRLPDRGALVCSCLAMTGVAVMSWTGAGFYMSWGELLIFGSSIFYASNIVAMSRLIEGCDALAVGFVQVLTMGVLAIICAFIFESPAVPTESLTYESLLYLAVICTSFGFTLQPLAQSRCSAETAGMMCTIAPPTGMILGVFVMGEHLTTMRITGLFLVVLSLILYTLLTNMKKSSAESASSPIASGEAISS